VLLSKAETPQIGRTGLGALTLQLSRSTQGAGGSGSADTCRVSAALAGSEPGERSPTIRPSIPRQGDVDATLTQSLGWSAAGRISARFAIRAPRPCHHPSQEGANRAGDRAADQDQGLGGVEQPESVGDHDTKHDRCREHGSPCWNEPHRGQ
jgi:hypothetical protein